MRRLAAACRLPASMWPGLRAARDSATRARHRFRGRRGLFRRAPVQQVPGVGVEPTRPKPQDFKSRASTNSATPANAFSIGGRSGWRVSPSTVTRPTEPSIGPLERVSPPGHVLRPLWTSWPP